MGLKDVLKGLKEPFDRMHERDIQEAKRRKDLREIAREESSREIARLRTRENFRRNEPIRREQERRRRNFMNNPLGIGR